MDYIIRKGNKKRRNISITIKNSEVVVLVPHNYIISSNEQKQIDELVEKSRGWIEKKLAKNKKNLLAINSAAMESSLMLFGSAIEIIDSENSWDVMFKSGKLYVPNRLTEKARKKAIYRWYRNFAEYVLEKRLAEMSNATKLKYSAFSLTSAKRKWGSCSQAGKIMLNYRLIALPDRLIDYVIIHELCHTVEMSHNPNFWNLVGKILPDYKKRKNAIKDYSEIMDLI